LECACVRVVLACPGRRLVDGVVADAALADDVWFRDVLVDGW
jgi:hypothetical protein